MPVIATITDGTAGDLRQIAALETEKRFVFGVKRQRGAKRRAVDEAEGQPNAGNHQNKDLPKEIVN